MSESAATGVDARLLSRFVPISGLSDSHLDALAAHAEILDLDAGARLPIKETFPEKTLYLVEGEVEVLADGKRIDAVVGGTEPARFSLAHVAVEKRTARARTAVRLLRMERARISTLLVWSQTPSGAGATGTRGGGTGRLPTSLLASELFARIPPASVERIGARLEERRVRAGEAVIRQGEPGEHYYVVRDGRCAVTFRPSEDAEPVELAILGEGDTFGEEALITGARRNATVTAMTEATLLRLTKTDFMELVRDPLLSVVGRRRAHELIGGGARWLDVRLREEHSNGAIEGSVNVPLGELRERARELDGGKTWIAYCNSGRRSSAAAFLLIERGIPAHVLKGGLDAWLGEEEEPEEDASTGELQAQLLMANAELEEALHHKAEADVARESEALPPDSSSTTVEKDALEQRRRRLEDRSRHATEALDRAKERKRAIEAKLRATEARAARAREKTEAEVRAMRQEAEQRLQREKERLQEAYRKAASRIEQVKRAQRQAQERFRREKERLEAEYASARREVDEQMQRIREEVQSAKKETEQRAEHIRSEQESDAERLRAELEQRLREERKHLESEFAASLAEQEQASRDLDATEGARRAAEREAEHLAERIRAAQERRRAEEEARLESEYRRLERAAADARERLEGAKRAMARGGSTPRAGAGEEVVPDIAAVERQVDDAERARAGAAHARQATEQRHAAQRAIEEELRLELFDEMEQWLRDDRAGGSDAADTGSENARDDDDPAARRG